MKALLIDLDGVLYVGDRPVPGASESVGWLREQGIPHLFLTNTTSRPRRALVEKLAGLGIDATEHAILAPPVAATRWLMEHASGPAALFVAPATVGEFEPLPVAPADQPAVASVVVGDYGECWTYSELNRAFRLLMHEPQPALVALGMTRYWLADDGLRLDTAPFVAALAYASGAKPVVLGKPARPLFEKALTMLKASPAEALMIGDDIQGDIAGAQAAGIPAALVRTGKFRPGDLGGAVEPEFLWDSIAELPHRWQELVDTTM